MSQINNDKKEQCEKLLVDNLIQFQFIEQALKDHIAKEYELIKLILNGATSFNYSAEDIKKQSLGSLIDTYSKISDNESFIKDLKGVVSERNDIAHKAFNRIHHCQDFEDVDAEISKLNSLKMQLENCLLHILMDMTKQATSRNKAVENNAKLKNVTATK